MKEDKLLGMLGLARRAGRVVIGTEQVSVSLSKRADAKPTLVLISEEASDGAKKKLTCKCDFYKIEYIIVKIEMTKLGRILGKSYAPVVVGITDEGFAKRIKEFAEGEG